MRGVAGVTQAGEGVGVDVFQRDDAPTALRNKGGGLGGAGECGKIRAAHRPAGSGAENYSRLLGSDPFSAAVSDYIRLRLVGWCLLGVKTPGVLQKDQQIHR